MPSSPTARSMRLDSPPARQRSMRSSRSRRSTRLELDLAGEDIPPHDPVPDERVERVREGGGAVPLEEEVADPGEQVTSDEPDQDVQQPTGQQRRDQADETDRGAGEVETPTRAVRMLGQVEGIELAERRVSLRLAHVPS